MPADTTGEVWTTNAYYYTYSDTATASNTPAPNQFRTEEGWRTMYRQMVDSYNGKTLEKLIDEADWEL